MKSNVDEKVEMTPNIDETMEVDDVKPVMMSSFMKSPANMQSTPNDPKIHQHNKFKDLNTTPVSYNYFINLLKLLPCLTQNLISNYPYLINKKLSSSLDYKKKICIKLVIVI